MREPEIVSTPKGDWVFAKGQRVRLKASAFRRYGRRTGVVLEDCHGCWHLCLQRDGVGKAETWAAQFWEPIEKEINGKRTSEV